MRFLNSIKALILLAALLELSACSSQPKSESEAKSSEAKAQMESVKPPPSTAAKVAASENSFANAKAEKESALNEAMKNGNEDAIYHAASAVLMQNSANTKALNAIGLFHLHKGRPLAARFLFNKASSLQPTSSEFQTNLGLTYLATKEDAEAFRRFHKAIELNPRDTNASTNLAAIYMTHRDFGKAFGVLSLNSGANRDVKFLNNFAIASASKGKIEQAESLYKEALKLSPNTREVLFNYAILQIDYQKKFKEGLETLDHLQLIGLAEGMKNTTKELENRAKAGLK